MSIYKIFPSLDQTFRKLCSSLAFCNFSNHVFVRLSVTRICFRFNFLLFLKIFALTLYLENLMIIGRGLFLSSFRLPKRCHLPISWCVISFFFRTLIPTSSVFSWFSSSIPCIQFLLEYCYWRSKALSALSSLTFKLLMGIFSSAIFLSPIRFKFFKLFFNKFYRFIHFLLLLSAFNLVIICSGWEQVYFVDLFI